MKEYLIVMPRYYRRKKSNQTLAILIILVGLAAIATQSTATSPSIALVIKYLLFTIFALTVITACGFAIRQVIVHFTRQQRAANFASLRAHDVDNMTGKEFEIFLQHLLTARGFKVKGVYHGNDGGVDIVARKEKDTYSIQAKRYNSRKKVDRRAITDAVAGMKYQNCTKSMAVTNSYFTKAAKEYAERTKCTLIDRDRLAKWIHELDN